MEMDAVISKDGRYRYLLTRRWAAGPPCVFIGLNPSTADASVDDPTIRRCVGYAKAWDCGALWMLNLFAYRATKPADLPPGARAVGPYNNRHLFAKAMEARAAGGIVLGAWGANPRAPERLAEIRNWIGPLLCLGVTNGGQPRHPLYVRKDLLPEQWSPCS